MLRIKDLAFEVDSRRSEFFAYIPQEAPGQEARRLCWSLEIYGVEKENELGFGTPALMANEMTLAVRDWRQIEGQTIRSEGTAGLAAYLHAPEPQRTADNTLRFVARRDHRFTIAWDCLADLCWDDDYASRLPLRLDAEIAFNGVHTWWLKADAQGLRVAKELVGRHLDLACLQEPASAGPYHIVFLPRL